MFSIIKKLLFAAIIINSHSAFADNTKPVAIIYPDIGEPYRQIFEKIIEGVDESIGYDAANYAVTSDTNISSLKMSLHEQNIKVLISLGRQGMKAGIQIKNGVKVVVGGVLSVSENDSLNVPVLSLTPDPGILFAKMKSLLPSLKRIYVVYDPRSNEWLIKLAQDEARSQGLELTVYKALDLRKAIDSYSEIFGKMDNHSEALWLPQDSTTVDDSLVVPLVLQESWNRNLPVFSSSFNHVKRGILFSCFPDNLALGNRLGSMANQILRTGNFEKVGLIPLRDVQSAVNLRTANHIGLSISGQKMFDMTLPEQ